MITNIIIDYIRCIITFTKSIKILSINVAEYGVILVGHNLIVGNNLYESSVQKYVPVEA